MMGAWWVNVNGDTRVQRQLLMKTDAHNAHRLGRLFVCARPYIN